MKSLEALFQRQNQKKPGKRKASRSVLISFHLFNLVVNLVSELVDGGRPFSVQARASLLGNKT